ncbi:caspase family protein [Micromonospora wenchangensis]|uniref:caspase family protein n=1 Tax=Micromonospora wenchangensis TaxID=1185415 RepID=UPI003D71E86D
MRKALIVGIDYYTHFSELSGCVNDANAVRAVLERHADGRLNFATPQVLLVAGTRTNESKREPKEAVRELFDDDAEIALLYFARHGHIEETGGYLCAYDCESDRPSPERATGRTDPRRRRLPGV